MTIRTASLLSIVLAASCGTTAPVTPAYQPKFSYAASPTGQKLDVTVGIVAPQLSTQSRTYVQRHQNDEVVRNMISAVASTFAEMLSAKGFNTKGPFPSTNDMTFPDKKGSDLLMFPEFDFDVSLKPEHLAQKAQAIGILTGETSVVECDMVVSVAGNIQFVVTEPLTGERMWIKRVDVSGANQVVNGQRAGCQGGPISQETRNAWLKAHETLYQTTVAALGSYVNGEEFQGLKRQSQELRAKKTY